MFSRRTKTGCFVIEGLNSFTTVYYFYYFYFFMQKQFGYDNRANLLLAALNGAAYAVFAYFGGSFAQRFGYFRALKLGFAIMILALAMGLQISTAPGHIAVMVLTVLGMSLTWPTLEAIASEGETRAGVQHMLGIYNVVWAATAAIGNFTGGAMLDYLGLKSLFYVPILVLCVQLALTVALDFRHRRSRFGPGTSPNLSTPPASVPVEVHPEHPARAKSFLRMAWLANPFAYIAINTLVAVMPGLTLQLGLSTTLAGFCCSVWCFSRLGAFTLFWLWDGWHYRFRWLLLAYLGLAATFISVLLAPNVPALVSGQVFFGIAVGLIYYSSLFYSMDCSETKGEHGGIHESAIGIGNFAGPAVGAAALQFLPHYANSGAYAVTLLLLLGLGGLAMVWRTGKTP
jgi:MFS family permease